MKKILKVLLIVILSLLTILAVAPVIFKGKIISIANEQMNKSLNAKASFTDINLSFFRNFPNLSIRLEGLCVAGIDEFEGDTLANIEAFDISINVVSAIKMENIELKRIGIKSPQINAIVLSDGKANWDIAPESEEEEEQIEEPVDTSSTEFTTTIALKLFEISNAQINYTDYSSNMSAALNNFNFALSGDLGQDFSTLQIDSETEQLSFTMDGVKYLNKVLLGMHFDVDANLKESIYTLKENSVALNELTLGFNGSIEMPESGDIITDLEFATSNTSFKTLLSLVPAIYLTDFSNLTTSGKLQLQGKVKGAVTETTTPSADIALRVENASFSYPDLPKSAKDIQIDIQVHYDGVQDDNTTVDVNQFHVDFGGNPIDLALNLKTPMSDPFTNGKLHAQLNLASVLDIIPLENTMLKGTINTNLDWMGSLSSIENEQYEDFKADGLIQVAGLYYNSPNVPEAFELKESKISFSPKQVTISSFDAKLGESDFRISGKLSNFIPFALQDGTVKGELTLASNTINLNQFMTESVDDTEEANTPETETEESEDMEVIEVPKNIDFRFASNIGTIYYDKLEINNMLGVIEVKDGRVLLDRVNMKLLDGEMKISGEYNTSDIKNPLVDFSFDANHIDIQKSLAAFDVLGTIAPIAKQASGNVSLGMSYSSLLMKNMKPVLKSIAGHGRLGSEQIGVKGASSFNAIGKALKTDALNDMIMKNIDLEFQIQNGSLQVQPFETQVGNIAMLIGGEQTFENMLDYDINLKAPRELLGLENPAVNSLYSQAASQGLNISRSETVDLIVKLTGAMADPKVSLDLKKSMSKTNADIKESVKENVSNAVSAKKEEAKADAKAEARKEADKILKEAEAKAKLARSEGKKAADAVRREADSNANKLVQQASNPITRKAAEVSAKEIRKEGDNKANALEREANQKADRIMREAQAKADRLLR